MIRLLNSKDAINIKLAFELLKDSKAFPIIQKWVKGWEGGKIRTGHPPKNLPKPLKTFFQTPSNIAFFLLVLANTTEIEEPPFCKTLEDIMEFGDFGDLF